ncbi:MAG: hypothetical protein F4Z87_07265 [Gammaproteobacteria bacterium]|nr:hypothetical protein [Gammaproteobacteria bacterium]
MRSVKDILHDELTGNGCEERMRRGQDLNQLGRRVAQWTQELNEQLPEGPTAKIMNVALDDLIEFIDSIRPKEAMTDRELVS